MKCRYCGGDIPAGRKVCPSCGKFINKVSSDTEYQEELTGIMKHEKRGMGLKDHKKLREQARLEEIEAERRKKRQKRVRNRIFSVTVIVALCVFLTSFVYLNSYAGLVNSGDRYARDGNEVEAVKKYKKAIKKAPAEKEAYEGMAKIYLARGNKKDGEKLYLKAIKQHPGKVDLYESLIKYYEKTDQIDKIAILMKNCKNQGVRDDLNRYVSDGPKFSLKEGTYDDVQQLSLLSTEKAIYYTDDGSEPTKKSHRYKEPILLGEGKTVIRAIAFNKADVPSTEVKKTYNVVIPVVDVPSVSPSTGAYTSPQKITVKVPSGCTCYYTITPASQEMKEPTEKDSVYTDPIDMPKGKNIFCAVLVDGRGRRSDIKIMNYDFQ